MSKRIIRLPEVKHKTGNSRSTIYDLMRDDLFPKPIKITNHAVGWVEEEVDAWIAERITKSRGENTQ